MGDKSIPYRLLSLFTTPDRAESIEGDLNEERHTYGHVWFAFNVVSTTFALWRQTIELDFLRTMALGVLAVVLSCLVCSFLGFAYVEFQVSGVTMLLMVGTFAFLLGAGLVRVAPAIGAAAAIAASLALLLLFIYSQIDAQAAQLRTAAEGNTIATSIGAVASLVRNLAGAAVLYLLPLNLGSVLMHGRGSRR